MGASAAAETVRWRDVDGRLSPVLIRNGGQVPVAWAPQPGSAIAFLECPTFETLLHGPRGTGKTETLIMDYAGNVGQGLGQLWRGIMFRRSYPELADVIDKTLMWFPRIFPGAKFNSAKTTWTWPGGESLLLRHIMQERDYNKYHGHNYAWIGFEELTRWPSDVYYRRIFSCCRSPDRRVPKRIRATTNSGGVGHNWVKSRFHLPTAKDRLVGPLISETTKAGVEMPGRRAIGSTLSENKVLLHADPYYVSTLESAAANDAERRAWIFGDWTIVAGGMFDDVWEDGTNIVKPFEIPRSWRIDRSFDWGSSKPFSVCWWAESDGTDYQRADGTRCPTVRGDLYIIDEWYGWDGRTPNTGLKMLAVEVARGVLEREKAPMLKGRVKPGVADSSIWTVENGMSIEADMGKVGVRWTRADKSPGSRKTGWELMRKLMKGARRPKSGIREDPGLFAFDTCEQFVRTVPVLQRDERAGRDPDDADTNSEDHIADATRYRVRALRRTVTSGRTIGHY